MLSNSETVIHFTFESNQTGKCYKNKKIKKSSDSVVCDNGQQRALRDYIHSSAFSAYQRLVSLFVDRVKHERQQSPILFRQWSVLHTSTVAKKSDMVPQLDHTEDLKHTWSWPLQLGVGLWWWIVAPFKFQLPLFDAQDRTLGNLIASNISQRMKVKLVLLMLLLLLLLLLCSFHPTQLTGFVRVSYLVWCNHIRQQTTVPKPEWTRFSQLQPGGGCSPPKISHV